MDMEEILTELRTKVEGVQAENAALREMLARYAHLSREVLALAEKKAVQTEPGRAVAVAEPTTKYVPRQWPRPNEAQIYSWAMSIAHGATSRELARRENGISGRAIGQYVKRWNDAHPGEAESLPITALEGAETVTVRFDNPLQEAPQAASSPDPLSQTGVSPVKRWWETAAVGPVASA